MQRVKVLQVITGLGPGGAERLVLDMMGLFDANRFDMRLATIVDDLRALEVYGHQSLPVEVFELRSGPRLAALRRMRAFVKDFAPDVIHAHMFHSLLAAWATSRFLITSPAICFTSHNSKHLWGRKLVIRWLKSWRDADIIFTAGQHPELNVDRTEVIPNGVPVGVDPPMRLLWDPAVQVRLLAVGRLAEAKDPLGLLRSMARANLPGVSLEFVGAGPLEDKARILAAELGLANRVRFCGVCDDVRERMRAADVLVMHSKYEGMPMALLEAGAEAMPVLATPVGSIPDLMGGDRGWLAQPEQFADTLGAVVADPAAAISAGRRLYAYVLRTHSIQATVREHERLYLKLAELRD